MTEIASFPLGTSFRNAPMVVVNNVFYTFGGINETGKIAEILALVSGSTWVNMGMLNSSRNAHNALWTGSQFMVVGGGGDTAIELCDLINGKISCVDKQPIFSQYRRYPEMFLVDADFCQ